MKNQTILDIVDNHESKSAWSEYVASGLMKEIGSFHLCLTIHALNKSGMAAFFLKHNHFSLESLLEKYDAHIVSHFLEYLQLRTILVRSEVEGK